MATKLIIDFFLKSAKEMSEDDMPHDGSEALLGSDEAGTASKLYRRHHLLAETRRDIRQTTGLLNVCLFAPFFGAPFSGAKARAHAR